MRSDFLIDLAAVLPLPSHACFIQSVSYAK
jgi:hypothetical protein